MNFIIDRQTDKGSVSIQVASDILKKLPAAFDLDKTRKMFGISISPTTVVLLQVTHTN